MSSSCVNSRSSWSSMFLLSCGSTAPVEGAAAPTLSAAAVSAAALSPAALSTAALSATALSAAALSPTALSAAATAALSAASLAVLSGCLGSAGLGVVGGARLRGKDASSPLHASSSSSSLGGRRTPIMAAPIPTRGAGGATAAWGAAGGGDGLGFGLPGGPAPWSTLGLPHMHSPKLEPEMLIR
eukprot:scaffold45383_cov55-Phaeocystis_antarctica.AAC.1